ncbi:NUDIX domain-containing protein [Streptomyces anulatus]|uniref:NUDIX domain-containing protein n=1 Tax=Streptomyces anulatus TaxID=1892 RepID=UPI003644D3E9
MSERTGSHAPVFIRIAQRHPARTRAYRLRLVGLGLRFGARSPRRPGGKAEPGEAHDEAAAPELKEETGLLVDPVDLSLVHVEQCWDQAGQPLRLRHRHLDRRTDQHRAGQAPGGPTGPREPPAQALVPDHRAGPGHVPERRPLLLPLRMVARRSVMGRRQHPGRRAERTSYYPAAPNPLNPHRQGLWVGGITWK